MFSVDELVPHSSTMSLLDEIVSFDEEQLQASLTIREDSTFADERGVPSWVGLEYMAQTIAAYAGAQAKNNGESVKIGFLLGTRKYQCSAPYFHFGQKLIIDVKKEIDNVNGLSVFLCSIIADELLVEASVNVFQPDDAMEFLGK